MSQSQAHTDVVRIKKKEWLAQIPWCVSFSFLKHTSTTYLLTEQLLSALQGLLQIGVLRLQCFEALLQTGKLAGQHLSITNDRRGQEAEDVSSFETKVGNAKGPNAKREPTDKIV